MTLPEQCSRIIKTAFPSRAIALLMGIGFFDLVLTAVLHANGLIVELNPLMKVFIERSEWLFCGIKAATLVAAWYALNSYAKVNLSFVRNASLLGAGIYLSIWITWFLVGD